MLLLALLVSAFSFSSDHIDGPVTMQHRVADLSDLYAFPTPKKPGFLTVILNTYPIVPKEGHFSEKVSYTFYIRKASVQGSADRPAFATGEEVAITCSFVTPTEHENHVATCKGGGLETVSNFNEVVSSEDSPNLRVYAGKRSDPFFFNSDWATAASAKGKLLPPKNNDVMSQTNILSIVLEVNTNKIFAKPHTLFAIATEAMAKDSAEAKPKRMDRLGRPEVTNVSMVSHKNDAELRDQFNEHRPFQVDSASQQAFKERLVKNITYYDGLDKQQNWSETAKDSLATMIAEDFLVVDISKPCNGDTFFEIEKSLFLHKPYETCGGRQLTDDIMDTLFTIYIAGIDGKRIKDGVDHPHREVSTSFPYLAEPDLSLTARGKAFIARKLLGIKN
jgi:hypothetical protein